MLSPVLQQRRHLLCKRISLSLLVAALVALCAYVRTHRPKAVVLIPAEEKLAAKAAPIPMSLAALDMDSRQFEIQTALIRNARECFPLHVREASRIGILYLYCSDQALDVDGQGVVITDNFSVPTELARRYNFWRRVYSLWSADQYVLHSAIFPEVIFEIYDATRLDSSLSDFAREKAIKALAKVQRAEYVKLLLTMHKLRNRPSVEPTPAMQRIERSMRHLTQPDKYLVAAQGLRIQRGQRDFIARGLTVGPKYLPHVEEEFASQGVPKELARLAYIESSFNLLARSKVGASGVFQIMPDTGHDYLMIFDGVDERNDPIKASRAAAKLLRLNHDMLGNWPLAITAYNHGVGGIRRAMRATGSNDLTYLISHFTSPNFQFASKNFYTGFLGMLATLQDAERIFPEIPKVAPIGFEPIRLGTWTNIPTLKKRYSLSNEDIASYNPDITRAFIRSGGTLPRGYVLKIPARIPALYAGRAGSEKPRLIP